MSDLRLRSVSSSAAKFGFLVLGAAIACSGPVLAQEKHLEDEPAHYAGQGITPAFEGWFRNQDGTFSILVGYYNRNMKQTVDIPVGPDNKIEPGPPDQGQPTHFLPGRGWGPWSITVPKDFGDKELTWTITANGQTNTIPINIKPLWEISPFIDALNNTPPFLSFQNFDENGPTIAGPKPLYITKTTKVGTPLPLTVFVADDVVFSPGRTAPANPITVSWSEYRGPAGAAVKFSAEKPKVEKADFKKTFPKAVFYGKAATDVTFDTPGDYDIYVAINDASGTGGGGGFQCCWTNGHVKVTVQP